MGLRDDLIGEAVDAILARIKADEDRDAAIRRREVAVWRLYHDAGMTAPDTSRALVVGLRAAGLSEDKIRGQGASYDAVRKTVEGVSPI
jgi:hypothetical protein